IELAAGKKRLVGSRAQEALALHTGSPVPEDIGVGNPGCLLGAGVAYLAEALMRFALLPAKQRRSKQSARELFSLGPAPWSRQAPFVDQRPRFHQRSKGQGHSCPGPGDERAFPVACTTWPSGDRKSTRLNSSHGYISYAVFCLKKKKIPYKHHSLL